MQDILLDKDGDLDFVNGDFKIGDAVYQDVQLLLATTAGGFRQYPQFGMDLIKEIENDRAFSFKAELKKQLKSDNKKIKTFNITDGKLNIDVEEL